MFGKLDGAEIIAGHEHVVGGEVHQRVAVGVGAADRDQMHVFAIHVDGHGTFVGHHRQRGGGSGNAGRAVGSGRGMSQPIAQFIAREDGDAHVREILVAAGVIAVHVGVHQEANRLVGNLMDGRGDLLRQRRELRVHHEDSIRPDQHADSAALAFERVEIVADLGGLDFHFAEIGLRSLRIDGGGEHRE